MTEILTVKSKKTKLAKTEILIKEIELFNFMCHSRLKVEFRNRITCISGRNGSGKSSIMIAIGILLGQRVSSMERGTLKNLIQKGKSNSLLILKLNNYKKYKAEFFKDGYIKIQKSITLAGSNTFKICNAQGNVFSRKVEDLEYILDIYNINLNILNFLTQDNSKKFLNVSNEKDLYELFVDSTDLKSISELYCEALGFINQIEVKIENENDELKELKNVLESKEALINNILNVERNKQEIDFLEEVKLLMKFLAMENFLNEIQREIDENEQKIGSKEKEYDEINNKINKEKERKEELIKKNKEIQMKHANFLDTKNKEIKEIELNKIEIKNDIEMFQSQISSKIENLKKFDTKNSETNFENQLEELNNKLNDLQKNKEVLSEEVELLETYKNQYEIQQTELNKQIFSIGKQISFYKQQSENQLNFFGGNIKRILNEIESTKFKDLIIGPIGLYLDLKDPNYSTAVSTALKNRLNSFIVFNNEDSKALASIFKQNDVKYPIILPSRKHININYYKEESKYNSILKSIRIRNNPSYLSHTAKEIEGVSSIIKDNLILFDSIETTYLSEDRREAYEILNNLKRVDSIFTKEGDRIKVVNKILTEFRPKNIKSFFKGNQIDILNKKLSELKSIKIETPKEIEYLLLKYKTEDVNCLIESLNKNINGKEIENLTKKIRETEYERKLLNEERNYEDEENKKKREKSLRKEIEFISNQLNNGENQLREFNGILNKIEEEIKREKGGLNDVLKAVNENLGTKDLHMEKLIVESDLKSLQNTNEALNENKGTHLNIFNEEISNSTEILKKHEHTNLQKYSDLEEINSKIKTLKEQNEVMEDGQFDLNEIQKQYEILKKDVLKKEELLKKYNLEILKYRKESEKGLRKMEKFKEQISKEVSGGFQMNAAMRNYRGSLIFNHEEKTLEVLMGTFNIQSTEKGTEIYGNKGTLSGGERSFAGICLLLSIYKFIKSPLKILDECDVFMDNLNRNAAFRLIFDFFKNKEDQVILITPLGFCGFDCDVITIEKVE